MDDVDPPRGASAGHPGTAATRPLGAPPSFVPGKRAADRPVDPVACPLLRLVDGDELRPPAATSDERHRCMAGEEPTPLSARQQELVCLRAAHVECPLFVPGPVEQPTEPAPEHRSPPIPLPVAAALLLLLLCAGVSVGFIIQRGGLALPTAPATLSAASTQPGAASPSAVAAASPMPTDAPSPSLTASPAPSPLPSPSPTPVASPSPSASIGSRVALLTPCPDAPNCYLYRVRTNDVLIGIAYYFGVSLATIYEMNPRYAQGAVLRTGDLVRLPPPTR